MDTRQRVKELVLRLIKATNSSSIEESFAVLLTSTQTANQTRGLIQGGFLQLLTKLENEEVLTVEEMAIVEKNLSFFINPIEIAESNKLTTEPLYEDDTRGEVPVVIRGLRTELKSQVSLSREKDDPFVSLLVDSYLINSENSIRAAAIKEQRPVAIKALKDHTYTEDPVAYLDKVFGYTGAEPAENRRALLFSAENPAASLYIERHNRIAGIQLAEQEVLVRAAEDYPSGDRTAVVNLRHYARAIEVLGQIPEYRENREELHKIAYAVADAAVVYEDPVVYGTSPQKLLESVLRTKGVSDKHLQSFPVSTLSDTEQKQGLHYILKIDTHTLFSAPPSTPIGKVGTVLVGNTFIDVAKESIKGFDPLNKTDVPAFLSPFVAELVLSSEDPKKNVAVQHLLAASSGKQQEGSFIALLHLSPGEDKKETRIKEGATHLLSNLFPESKKILLANEHTQYFAVRARVLGEQFSASLPQPFIAFVVQQSSLLRSIGFRFAGKLFPMVGGGRLVVSAGTAVATRIAGAAVGAGVSRILLLGAGIMTGPVGIALTALLQVGIGFLGKFFNRKKEGEKQGSPGLAMGCLIGVAVLLLFVFIIPMFVSNNLTNINLAITTARTAGILEDTNSQFIDVTKSVSPGTFPDNNAGNVVYTISITAKGSALTNITVTDSFSVLSKGSAPPTPSSGLTAPPSVLQEGETYSTTYTVNLSGFKDSLITNTLTVTADAGSTTGESSTTTASVTIGSPPTGCFELRDDTISYQDGSSTFSTTRWNAQERGRVLEAIAVLSRSPSYMGTLCRNNEPILVYRSAGSVTYGGFAPQSRGNTIFLYSAGVSSGISTVYTLSHESGHILYYRSALFDQYLASGVPAGEGWLPTYPLGKSNFEDFAETFGVFFTVIVYGQDMNALSANQFKTSYTRHYNFARSITGL